jgi:hypothetical protein
MEERDRITLGIAVAVIGIAAMSREFLWTNSQLNYLQYFFLYGVEKGRRTEAFIGRLPGG